jgi:hypothetical protein
MNQLLSFRPSFRNLLLLSIVVVFTSTAGSPVLYQDEICTGPFETVSTPLTELGNQPYLRMDGTQTQFRGGLYPNGSNTRPSAHESAGLTQTL